MAPSEGFVQVAVDGVGKKIRNQVLYVQEADGTYSQVYSQLVGLVDTFGNPVDPDLKPTLEELLVQQTRLADMFELLLGNAGSSAAVGFLGRTALGAAVSGQNIVPAVSDPFGRQITVPWGSRDMFAVGLPATITDTTVHTLKSGEPGIYLDLVLLLITNTSTATNSRVDISDGTNVYPLMSVGGAGPVGFSSGLILPATKQGVDWTITAAAAVTDLRVIAEFVRNK